MYRKRRLTKQICKQTRVCKQKTFVDKILPAICRDKIYSALTFVKLLEQSSSANYINLTMSGTHIDRDLDLKNASRGVWLVKVPKYIANRWEKAPGDIEVGKLKIAR